MIKTAGGFSLTFGLLFFIMVNSTQLPQANSPAVALTPGAKQTQTYQAQYPAATPGGTQGEILFWRQVTKDQGSLYVINADGSHLRKLNSPATVTIPSWAADGTYLAYATDKSDVYVMKSDGTHVIRLTYDQGLDAAPSWSPDLKHVVFIFRHKDQHTNGIGVVNANGTGLRHLTEDSTYDEDPSWSPDGSRILFGSWRDKQFGIYTMDVNGTNVKAILTGGARKSWPRWSPDGEHIAFYAVDTDGNHLYVMGADGSDVHQLAISLPFAAYPA